MTQTLAGIRATFGLATPDALVVATGIVCQVSHPRPPSRPYPTDRALTQQALPQTTYLITCMGYGKAWGPRPYPTEPRTLTPSSDATMQALAMPRNSPCSTTPSWAFNVEARPAASAMPPATVTSRITLPLSVT